MAVDITTLGIEIRSDGVLVASERLKKLQQDGKATEQAVGRLSTTAKDADDKMKNLSNSAKKASDSFGGMGKVVKMVGAAFAGFQLYEMAKNAVLSAARVETLGVVLGEVGKHTIYSNQQINQFVAGLQKTGITMEESRASIVKLIQANVDLSMSSDLARIAQNAAVVANINSSEAFEKMTTGIATGQTVLLHHLGLMTNFEEAYKKTAESLGKSKDQLTEQEKSMARANEVVRAGASIQGAYEAAMSTAGKQLQSMTRYIKDFLVELGSPFLPEFTRGVKAATDALKEMKEYLKTDAGKGMMEEARTAIDGIFTVADKLVGLLKSLPSWIIGEAGVGLVGALMFGKVGAAGAVVASQAVQFGYNLASIIDNAMNNGGSLTDSPEQRAKNLNDKITQEVRRLQKANAEAKDAFNTNNIVQSSTPIMPAGTLKDAFLHTPEQIAKEEEYQKKYLDMKNNLQSKEISDYNKYISGLVEAKRRGDISQGELDELAGKAWEGTSMYKKQQEDAKSAEQAQKESYQHIKEEITSYVKALETAKTRNDELYKSLDASNKELDKFIDKHATDGMTESEKLAYDRKKETEDFTKAIEEQQATIDRVNSTMAIYGNELEELRNKVSKAKAALSANGLKDDLKNNNDLAGSEKKIAELEEAQRRLNEEMSISKEKQDEAKASRDKYTQSLIKSREEMEKTRKAEEATLANSEKFTDNLKGAVMELQDEVTNSGKNIAKSYKEAFDKAADALTQFVMTGKMEVNDFFNTIIAGIIKAQIQQSITTPLANSMSGIFGSIGNFILGKNAQGGVYDSPGLSSYENTIVSTPTVFPFATGVGLMGEAGPEAIMPLTRTSGGDLGVKVEGGGNNAPIINIIESPGNGGKIQQETGNNGQSIITVLVEQIKSSVANDISRGIGAVPSALASTYGLNRALGAY